MKVENLRTLGKEHARKGAPAGSVGGFQKLGRRSGKLRKRILAASEKRAHSGRLRIKGRKQGRRELGYLKGGGGKMALSL